MTDDELVERLAKATYGADPTFIFGLPNGVPLLVEWRLLPDMVDGLKEQAKHRKFARSCLAEIAAAGRSIVPNEPTKEMIDAGYHAMQYEVMSGHTYSEYSSDPPELGPNAPKLGYAAMLSASRKV